MTRQHKSPRQRAEEQLAVTERAVKRWAAKRDQAQEELEAAEREHATAVRRRDHARKHLDLTPTPDTSTTHPSTPGGTTR